MYNVMIVEDEMLVRLGFKNSVPWEKYGMTVCADAANGREAWDFYNNGVKPDLIITDLKMPIMDGIELIKKIRENDMKTRIVIVSCMEDFDLIRQAMQMGVSNYILKLTMTADDLFQAGLIRDKLEDRPFHKNGIRKLIRVPAIRPNLSKEVRWSVDLRYQPMDQDPMPQHGVGFLAK